MESEETKSWSIVDAVRAHFGGVHQAGIDLGYSDEDIAGFVDEAVEEVRAARREQASKVIEGVSGHHDSNP